MDLTTLTDTELDSLRTNVLNEQERRANLATIPVTLATLAAQFISGGGEQATIDEAVSPA